MAPTTKQKLAPACSAVSTSPWLQHDDGLEGEEARRHDDDAGHRQHDARLVQARRAPARPAGRPTRAPRNVAGGSGMPRSCSAQAQLVAEQRQAADDQHGARASCCREWRSRSRRQARQRAQGQRERPARRCLRRRARWRRGRRAATTADRPMAAASRIMIAVEQAGSAPAMVWCCGRSSSEATSGKPGTRNSTDEMKPTAWLGPKSVAPAMPITTAVEAGASDGAERGDGVLVEPPARTAGLARDWPRPPADDGHAGAQQVAAVQVGEGARGEADRDAPRRRSSATAVPSRWHRVPAARRPAVRPGPAVARQRLQRRDARRH